MARYVKDDDPEITSDECAVQLGLEKKSLIEGCKKLRMDVKNSRDHPTVSHLIPKPGGYSSVKINRKMQAEFNYFEIMINNPDKIKDICLGVAHSNYPLDSPLGKGEGSVGFRAVEGGVYLNAFGEQKVAQGPPLGLQSGDILGCGIDFSAETYGHAEIWFTITATRSNRLRNVVISPQKVDLVDSNAYHPVIGIETYSAEKNTNLGAVVDYLGHSKEGPPCLERCCKWYEVEGFSSVDQIPFHNKEDYHNITYDRERLIQTDPEHRRPRIFSLYVAEHTQGYQCWWSETLRIVSREFDTLPPEITKEEDKVALIIAKVVYKEQVRNYGLAEPDRIIAHYLQNCSNGHFFDCYAVAGLLYMGFDPNLKCKAGTHAIHTSRSHVCMKLLMNWGADPGVQDFAGNTILHKYLYDVTFRQMLVELDEAKIVKLDDVVNTPNNEGYTPLHCAAKHGWASSVDFLTERNAKTHVKTLQGNSPYDIAALFGHTVFLRKLWEVSVKKEKGQKSNEVVIEKWFEECNGLQHKWRKFRHDILEDLSTEQVHLVTIADLDQQVMDMSKHPVSVKRMLTTAHRHKIDLNPEALELIFNHCLFGDKLIMTDLLENDGQFDHSIPRSHVALAKVSKSSEVDGPRKVRGRRNSFHEDPESRAHQVPNISEKKERNITLMEYLSGRPKLFYSLIKHPTLQTYINYRWNKTAFKIFWLRLFYFIFQLFVLTFALGVAARPGITDDKLNMYPDPIDIPRGICEVLIVLMVMIKIGDEIKDIYLERTDYLYDWSNPFQWSGIVLIVILIILRALSSPGQWIVASLLFLTLAFGVFYYAAFLRVTGTYVRAISIIIGSDILKFMIIFVLTAFVFTGSFYFAARYDDSIVTNPSTNTSAFAGGVNSDQSKLTTGNGYLIPDSFLLGLRTLAESGGVLDYEGSLSLRPLTIILYVLFLFVTVVILLNVLIAQMSDTYTKVLSTAEGVYLYYRCRYIAKLENRRHRFKKRNCFRCLDKLKCSLEEGVCCCMRLKCCSRSKTPTKNPNLLWIPGQKPVKESSKFRELSGKLMHLFGDENDHQTVGDDTEKKLTALQAKVESMSEQLCHIQNRERSDMKAISEQLSDLKSLLQK